MVHYLRNVPMLICPIAKLICWTGSWYHAPALRVLGWILLAKVIVILLSMLELMFFFKRPYPKLSIFRHIRNLMHLLENLISLRIDISPSTSSLYSDSASTFSSSCWLRSSFFTYYRKQIKLILFYGKWKIDKYSKSRGLS